MGKKLIEVSPFLPLEAISAAASADKDKKTGTIKNVHKWFAPMPTPALRALIFGAVVDAPDDPEEHDRLLNLVRRLVPADGNAPDEATLAEARAAIEKSSGGQIPTIFDPFCGGGSTLVEAQRLGLGAAGSDLNPVPVLITRTLTELLPQVAGRPPVIGDPTQLGKMAGGPYAGLFADVKHYAEQIREAVWAEIGHLYPKGPNGETIIAWLWARTVPCPNPACSVATPMVSSTWLSKKRGQRRWLEISASRDRAQFAVEGQGNGPSIDRTVTRAGGVRCVACGSTISFAEIRRAGDIGRLGEQLTALACTDRSGERVYLSPPDSDSQFDSVVPNDPPEIDLAGKATINLGLYGFKTQADLYTTRQLVMLEAFAEQIAGVMERVRADGGDEIYARTVASVLGLALGKLAQSNSTQSRWYVGGDNGSSRVQAAFGRHAMPMVWDFVELNPFQERAANWLGVVESMTGGLSALPATGATSSRVRRSDARSTATALAGPVVIVTDPPYFDQIGYADLSDYFYVWHRRALRAVHPDLYGTIATPKEPELIATPYRHGGNKEAAAKYFIDGFSETFKSLRSAASNDHPISIIYAHRQEESSSLGSASTGWDAMLEAVLAAGLVIEGTLPIRGTSSTRQIGQGTNSLASYVVMVCRPRLGTQAPGTIAEFRAALRRRLPDAVTALLATGESMVDIRQAAIGPGMEVFSQFSSVFDGTEAIRVRTALTIINEELGKLLDEQLGMVDDDTRWACQWYADHGFEEGDYDVARKLAQAFGIGVDGLESAGIVEQGKRRQAASEREERKSTERAKAGHVRLVRRSELAADWAGDDDVPLWEALQHLVKRLTDGAEAGEGPASELLAELGHRAEGVRELAQYLTNLAIEKSWNDEAIAYDSLVKSWPRLEELASTKSSQRTDDEEGRLF